MTNTPPSDDEEFGLDRPDLSSDANGPGEDAKDSSRLDQTIQLTGNSDATVADLAPAEMPGEEDARAQEQTIDLEGSDTNPSIHPFGIGDHESDEESAGEGTLPDIEATIDMRSGQASTGESAESIDTRRDWRQSSIGDDQRRSFSDHQPSRSEQRGCGVLGFGGARREQVEPGRANQNATGDPSDRSRKPKLQIRRRDLAPPTRDADAPSDYRLVKLLGSRRDGERLHRQAVFA